jgi:1-acyl-sn-glycerol-3-phosphate acyltransferase
MGANGMTNWAIPFLAAIALIPIAYLLFLLSQRGRYSIAESFLYSIAYLLARGLWRATIRGQEHLAGLEGPAILVANHRSSIDPVLIQLAAGRRVHWMVAAEYCRHPLFGPVLNVFQVIPTKRGGIDTQAIKATMRLAGEGRWVGMFPEGRINRTSQPLLSVRPGAGLVALKCGAPLVPIWIEGSPQSPTVWGPLLKRAKVLVTIGEPMPPPDNLPPGTSDKEIASQWVRAVMARVAELGGHSDCAVQMAGRQWLDETQPVAIGSQRVIADP